MLKIGKWIRNHMILLRNYLPCVLTSFPINSKCFPAPLSNTVSGSAEKYPIKYSSKTSLSFEDSSGTESFVENLAEFLYLSEQGGFMLEDELGKTYHMKLVQHFFKMFQSLPNFLQNFLYLTNPHLTQFQTCRHFHFHQLLPNGDMRH